MRETSEVESVLRHALIFKDGEIAQLKQQLAAAEASGFKEEAELHRRQADDLTILVRRLCYQIKEENSTKRLALDYLKRTGREASVLRDGEFAAINAAKEVNDE